MSHRIGTGTGTPRTGSGGWIALLCALLATLLAPAALAAAPARDIADLLPDAAAIPDAAGVSPVERFDTSNLYESIDGEATLYEECGVVGMVQRVYRLRTASGELGVTARLFDMQTRLQAFGAYSQIRAASGRPAEVGAAGTLGRADLAFTQDRFVVTLSLEGAGADPERVLPLARALAGRLPKPASLPAELGILPRAGRVPRSESFFLRNALGLDFLHHAVSARYHAKGQAEPLQLVVAMLGDQEDARKAMRQLGAMLEGAAPLALGDEGLEGTHPGFGRVMAARRREHVAIVVQVADRAAALDLLRTATARGPRR